VSCPRGEGRPLAHPQLNILNSAPFTQPPSPTHPHPRPNPNPHPQVSALPLVRAALLDAQRHFAAHPPAPFLGAVLDGRDVGTVVCPAATAKLFVTASAQVRARRRLLELQEKAEKLGEAGPAYEAVLKAMQERDARDEGRVAAPLVPAADALVLDTTELSVEGALAAALEFVRSKMG